MTMTTPAAIRSAAHGSHPSVDVPPVSLRLSAYQPMVSLPHGIRRDALNPDALGADRADDADQHAAARVASLLTGSLSQCRTCVGAQALVHDSCRVVVIGPFVSAPRRRA